MSAIGRLVDAIARRYPWGLHSLKVLIALLLPAVIVWLADRRLRADTRRAEEEARAPSLPRLR